MVDLGEGEGLAISVAIGGRAVELILLFEK